MTNPDRSTPHPTTRRPTTRRPNSVEPEIHAVLIPGFWLGAWAWDEVVGPLQAAGITTHPVTLPGPGEDPDGTPGVTLDDRIEAVLALVDGLGGEVVLVGHSAGGVVAQGVIDRRPDRARRVIYVDSGPMAAGVALFPEAEADLELPSWEDLAAQNTSTEGMDDGALARFRRRATPVPVGVATAEIRLGDERRHLVPASMICTSFDSAMLARLIESGQIPSELGSVREVHHVDLPTGHWPMFSRPADLAAVLRDEILR